MKKLTIFEKHRLRIARDTLKMPKAIADAMGGMTKKQARDFINQLKKEGKIRSKK